MTPASQVHVSFAAWEIPPLVGSGNLAHALAHAATRSPVPQASTNSWEHTPAAALAVRAARPVLEPFLALRRPEGDHLFGIAVACNTESLDVFPPTATASLDCTAAGCVRKNISPTDDRPTTAAILARRFGLQGLSFTLSSGSSASSDAIVTAANAIRGGRAERMLVVSVEVDGAALRGLLAGDRELASLAEAGVLEGAAAVVLESSESLRVRRGRSSGRIGHCTFVHADTDDHRAFFDLIERHADKTFYLGGDSFLRLSLGAMLNKRRTPIVDFGFAAQRAYGSTSLLQLVAHCEGEKTTGRSRGAVIVGGGIWNDLRASVLVIEPA